MCQLKLVKKKKGNHNCHLKIKKNILYKKCKNTKDFFYHFKERQNKNGRKKYKKR